MNLRELYTDNLFREVFERLQKERASGKHDCLVTHIQGPEILSDEVLRDWIAFNYVWAVESKPDGSLMMGELGGVIPTVSNDGKQALAVSIPSMEKVLYGFGSIREYGKTKDLRVISELEEVIEIPLECRQGVDVVNGNANFAHYDFTTSVAQERELDGLYANPWFSSHIDLLISNRCLDNEEYVFNIPINHQVFERLRKIKEKGEKMSLKKREVLIDSKDAILPKDFIAGFHMTYDRNIIELRPVVCERELEGYESFLKEQGMEPVSSKISYIGTSGPYGRKGKMDIAEGRMVV